LPVEAVFLRAVGDAVMRGRKPPPPAAGRRRAANGAQRPGAPTRGPPPWLPAPATPTATATRGARGPPAAARGPAAAAAAARPPHGAAWPQPPAGARRAGASAGGVCRRRRPDTHIPLPCVGRPPHRAAARRVARRPPPTRRRPLAAGFPARARARPHPLRSGAVAAWTITATDVPSCVGADPPLGPPRRSGAGPTTGRARPGMRAEKPLPRPHRLFGRRCRPQRPPSPTRRPSAACAAVRRPSSAAWAAWVGWEGTPCGRGGGGAARRGRFQAATAAATRRVRVRTVGVSAWRAHPWGPDTACGRARRPHAAGGVIPLVGRPRPRGFDPQARARCARGLSRRPPPVPRPRAVLRGGCAAATRRCRATAPARAAQAVGAGQHTFF